MKELRAEMMAAARGRTGGERRLVVVSRRVVVKAERADVCQALGSFYLSARFGEPGLFRDRWGGLLVERGDADEFDVRAEWSERGESS